MSKRIKTNSKLLIAIIAMSIVFGLVMFNAVGAQGTPEEGLAKVGGATGLQAGQDIRVIIGNIIRAILGFMGAIALIIVLYAGFLYMTSGGDPEKTMKARRWLVNGLIGLIIIFSAYAIATFIITKIKGAISGEEMAIGGGGPGGLEIGGGINVFTASQILPNTPAAVNYPVKVFFSKGVDSKTITNNVQINKKAAKVEMIKTLSPIQVIEANNNGPKILNEILKADDGQKTGWVVCKGLDPQNDTYEGNSPMSIVFDISGLKEPISAKYHFHNINPSNQAFMNVSCGDKNNPAKVWIKGDKENKTKWLPPWDGDPKQGYLKAKITQNSIDVPKECFQDVADNQLYIQWKKIGGGACIRFDYMALEVKYQDYAGADNLVDFEFEVSGSTVKFIPKADCSDPGCKGQKCFDKNSEYQVNLKPGAIKSNTGIGLSCAAGSVCLHEFKTNEVCDVNAPTVYFVEPWNGAKVSKDADIDVTIKAADDGGISFIDFFVSDEFQEKAVPASGKNETTFYGYFSWNTEDVVLDAVTKKAVKKLKANAEDLDAHSASKEIEVTVLPAYCFDAFGSVICNKDGTKPECGACDGSACSSNSDCAGICLKKCQDAKAYICETNKDCASGVACGGICETPPVITNVAPDTAGPGNYVTISGKGFLSYQEGKSKFYFSGEDGEYLEAAIVKCGTAGKPSWSSNQIIVKVPEKAGSGPLKVVNSAGKEDSTVDDDGWKGEFEFDVDIRYPGLCAVQLEKCAPTPTVLCDEGVAGDLVKASGDSFGDEMADNDMIYFGTVPVGQGPEFSWKNKEIKGIQIPVVDPHWYGVTVAKEDSKDANKKIYSNPVNFLVIPAANLPKIDKISPLPAPLGQMVTISGQYFGKDVGHVEFRRFIDGQPYDWVAGLACAGSSWSDSEIIIKVPKEISNTVAKLEGVSAFSKDYQITVYNSKGIASKPVDFEIVNTAPGPGLCSLNPNNGPVGTKFNLSGENFGESKDYYIKFQAPDKKTVAVTVLGTWSEKLIEKVAVPAGAISGSVYLESNAADTENSNGLNFSVGSCKKDSCEGELKCCNDGICKQECKEAVEYSPSEYMWLVSTGPLPILPQVLERSCLIVDKQAVYSQSPSPFKNTEDACPNGMISATFNMMMDTTTFANNIEVRRCLEPDGEKCDFSVCTEKEQKEKKCSTIGQVKCLSDGTCAADFVKNLTVGDISETDLFSGCHTLDGKECQLGKPDCICASSKVSKFNLHESLADLAANDVVKGSAAAGYQLYSNAWYQVLVKGGQKNEDGELAGGVVSQSGKSMAADYVWTFKTKNENCVPENLLMEPFIGLISDLYGKQKYQVSGLYQCQSIALNNEAWTWGVQESYKTKILFDGYGCINGAEADVCPANSTNKRPDIGVYKLNTEEAASESLETPIGKPAIINASAIPTNVALKNVFNQLYKEAGLEVKFAAPKVISYYPNCQSACVNAEIGAHFSTQMSDGTMKPETVKLYSCTSADCVNLTPIALTATPNPIQYQWNPPGLDTPMDSNLKINPTVDLFANTYYRVVITNGVKSASLKPLAGLNYKTPTAPASDCGDLKDNDGDKKIDASGGYIYKGDDDDKLDYLCGCYETTKFVSYNKIDKNVTCPENAILTCIKIQWETPLIGEATAKIIGAITDATELEKIANENNYFAPDSECASAQDFEIGKSGAFDAFSWVFKTKASSAKCEIDKVEVVPVKYATDKQGEKIEYWSNPYSAPDECSEKGQILDPFDYGWSWTSEKTAVATITNTQMMADLPEFCTANCLRKGSGPVAAVCGDGKVESDLGEECDDSNYTANDGCSEKCLREPFTNCTSATGQNCCGNGIIDGKEECDAGCVFKDGKCVSSKESYCSTGCLKTGTAAGFVCGNGKDEAGEDKDDGNNKDGDGVSSICLNEGAKYTTTNKPVAMCGDGKIGSGEECEKIKCATTGSDCVNGLKDNPLCTDKCVWIGFPACGKCEKTIDCTINNTDCKTGSKIIACLPTDSACGCYKCCGNAQLEDYDGDGKADEECEINALSCKNKTTGASCVFGAANCVCDSQFPEWCSTKCLNLGSSYKYDSYCGDGMPGNGEDDECEDSGEVIGAPYQVATINKPIDFGQVDSTGKPVFAFNAVTKFVEGATKIIASTSQNNAEKKGEADLMYRTNDPDVIAQFCSTELVLNSAGSSPTPNMTGVCRNALLSFKFNKVLDMTSGAVALYKVIGTTDALVESTFTATNLGGETHVIVTPASLLEANTQYKVKLFNIKNVCGFYFSPWSLTFTTGNAICKMDKVKIEPSETLAVMPNQIHLFQALAMSGEQAITEVSGSYTWKWKWAVDNSAIASEIKGCESPTNGLCPSGSTGFDHPYVNITSYGVNGTATIFAETQIETDKNEPSTINMKTTGSAKLMVLICQNLWQPAAKPSTWSTLNISNSLLKMSMPTYVYENNYKIGILYCRDFGDSTKKADDLPKLNIVGAECSDTIDNDNDGKTDFNNYVSPVYIYNGELALDIAHYHTFGSMEQEYVHEISYDANKQEITYSYKLDSDNVVPYNEVTFEVGETKYLDYDLSGNPNLKLQVAIKNFFIDSSGSEKVQISIYQVTDNSDPDCQSYNDNDEGPTTQNQDTNLLAEYFLTRDATETDNSTDVIALRIYKNPEFLPPAVWYQKYAPNPADSTGSLSLDCQKDEYGEFCYPAAVDPPSVYIGASNLAGDDIYNNIYILSHSQNANDATLNIFNQLVAYARFNFQLPDTISKIALIRDTQRIQDMVLLRLYIEQYQQTHNGNAPALDSGTYERGMSFSVWPSWQNELGATLKQTLPNDPLNHFKWEKAMFNNKGMPCLNELKCPDPVAAYQCAAPEKYCVNCPVGYDKTTCYDSGNQKFFNFYANPDEHPVYSYQYDPEKTGNKSAYKIDFMLEITSKTYNIAPKF